MLRALHRNFSKLSWATVIPSEMSAQNPAHTMNLANGKWLDSSKRIEIPDPLKGGTFTTTPDTPSTELDPFRESLAKVTKSGLHNPFKNPERYNLYGKVCTRAASLLNDSEVFDHFCQMIQRLTAKSDVQCAGELQIVKIFFENFSGDNVRFLARGFSVPGDHTGQMSNGYRWPYGPVAVITPFNFPLEIPIMQLIGALLMGNKPLLKPEVKVAIASEQFIRFLEYCGMPLDDVCLLNGKSEGIETLITEGRFRNILFTGSQKIAEKIARDNKGKVKLEDAGFDWKILGPDVHDFEYVAYTSDQDAYAFSGQKCSAQSILFVHKNWVDAGFFEKIASLAGRRSLKDKTITPVFTWNNRQIQAHVDAVAGLQGARVLFGGRPVEEAHQIPEVYGSYLPTAVYVPLEQIMRNFELCSTELFGPFQVVTDYTEIDSVLEALEAMDNHLTAAVVSRDQQFLNYVLGNSVNGTTYAGIRARTTGAPQNHWFGPAGDPRGAGIGTPEAIKLVWSCHREIINDVGPISADWKLPPPS